MTDVDAVQSYLFASARLRESAGASELLVTFDEALKKLAEKMKGFVPHSAGGSALVLFEDERQEQAREFVHKSKRLLETTAVGARLSASEPIDIQVTDGFSDAVTQAARSLERNKRLGSHRSEPVTFPLARRCESCGVEPVVGSVKVGSGTSETTRFLGASCLAKHDARSLRWLEGHWPALDTLGWKHERAALADDFNELAAGSRLAVIVADANGVGQRLRGLDSPSAYQAFSQGLKKAIDTSLHQALKSVSQKPLGKKPKLPYQVLFCGGDDIVVACRQELALPFARKLTETFADQNQGAPWNSGQPIGLSVGIVCCNPGFPFLAAHEIAEHILAEAKGASRDQGWIEGAVDWAVVTESFGSAGRILDDRLIASPHGDASLRLTGRPYRVGPRGCRTLGSFEKSCQALGSGFPRNKLYQLRGWASARELLPANTEKIDEATVVRSLDALEKHLERFRDRLIRNETARDAWYKALELVQARDDQTKKKGAEPSEIFSSEPSWWTPIGDFADALTLWGSRS
jgi:hypothetical protein